MTHVVEILSLSNRSVLINSVRFQIEKKNHLYIHLVVVFNNIHSTGRNCHSLNHIVAIGCNRKYRRTLACCIDYFRSTSNCCLNCSKNCCMWCSLVWMNYCCRQHYFPLKFFCVENRWKRINFISFILIRFILGVFKKEEPVVVRQKTRVTNWWSFIFAWRIRQLCFGHTVSTFH